MRKPDHILYGRGEVPPAGLLAVLATQHVLVLSIFLASPVIVAHAAGLAPTQAGDLISLTMIGFAIASVLQVHRAGASGSGLLVIPTSQAAFIPGCLIAARTGGMADVAGLLLLVGLCEITLSRFLRRLRGVFPAELSGLIVLVTGVALAQSGMDDVVESVTAGTDWLPPLAVAAGTLTLMVGCSIWGRGAIRTLGGFIGLVCGYAAAAAAGLVDGASEGSLAAAPLLRLPALPASLPTFEASLLLPALVTGIAVTLNSIGALTAAQRLADADWKRQDMDGLGRGLLADGLGTMAAAAIGGAGISASASSVGLSANARATSPTIGYAVAAGFLAMALVPRFALLVLGVPRPVLGAALVYLSCSLLIGGISIMSSRLLDARKTFTLGIAFAFAASAPALTRVGDLLPHWMAPIMTAPLLAAALVALLLNPLLRLGIRQQVRLAVPVEGLEHAALQRFVTHAGAAWGARREVMARAEGAIAECLDALSQSDLLDGPIELVLGFDELALDTRLTWRGRPLTLSSTRPTRQELLHDEDAATRLAGYLIARVASRVRTQVTDGVAELRLTFDH